MYTGLQDKVSFSDIVFPFLFYLTTQIIASSMQKKMNGDYKNNQSLPPYTGLDYQ